MQPRVQAIANAPACKGKVVVIERGGCAFYYKAKRAVFAGSRQRITASSHSYCSLANCADRPGANRGHAGFARGFARSVDCAHDAGADVNASSSARLRLAFSFHVHACVRACRSVQTVRCGMDG
jgi:hypothetical protein